LSINYIYLFPPEIKNHAKRPIYARYLRKYIFIYYRKNNTIVLHIYLQLPIICIGLARQGGAAGRRGREGGRATYHGAADAV